MGSFFKNLWHKKIDQINFRSTFWTVKSVTVFGSTTLTCSRFWGSVCKYHPSCASCRFYKRFKKNLRKQLFWLANAGCYNCSQIRHLWRSRLVIPIKSVHFKKPVARISFLSKLGYFQYKSKQKVPQFWKKQDSRNWLHKMNRL